MANRRSDLDQTEDMLNRMKTNGTNDDDKIYDAGVLDEVVVEAKSAGPIAKAKPATKINVASDPPLIKNVVNTSLRKELYGNESLEGKGLNIKPGETLGLEGGTDYWTTKKGDVLESVDLEKGNVIGVNTDKKGKFKSGSLWRNNPK